MTRWIDFYLSHLESRHLAKSTVDRARFMLDRFFLWSGKDAREIVLKDIEEYRIYLGKIQRNIGEIISIEHQNKNVRMVANFFRWLHEHGKILSNPCAGLPPLKKPGRIPRGVITDAEVTKLLQQPNLFNPIGFRDRTLLELLYSTGLRASEACHLMLYDVDLETRMVRVNQGKGKRDRLVPIGKIAADYVAEYIRKVRPILLARADSWKVKRDHVALRDCGLLFLSKCGNALHPNLAWRMVCQYRDMAGLSMKITTHSLRHACAIEMLRGGASIRHVQEMLGHSQIDTTQIYTRMAPFDLKKAHARTSPSERRRKTDVPIFEKKAWRDNRNKW